jgi:hypothetical protein
MARSFLASLANAMLDAYETHIGAAPRLRFYTGAPPASAATARTGTLLAELTLPSDWMAAAVAGSSALAGTWTGTGLPAAGTGTAIGHFAMMNAAGTVCFDQGTITVTGGGGDMTLDNVSLATGQTITVTGFTLGLTV